MTTSTLTNWEVDSISLQTYAWNITTLGGDRLSPPPTRGSNLTIPSAPGRKWVPKQVDQRVITLGMWIAGCEENGTAPLSGGPRKKFIANWEKLRELLWVPHKEITLTKKFYDGAILKTASAKAQFSSGLSPNMTGGARANFTVDLELADPYFYGVPINTTLSTGNNTVTVSGDYRTHAVKFEVTGPRKNLKIRNTTLGIQVEYRGDLSSGDKLNIDVKNFTSVTDPVATNQFNSIGSILHDGDAFWMLLAPGDNVINVTSDTGIGSVIMTHQEVWL